MKSRRFVHALLMLVFSLVGVAWANPQEPATNAAQQAVETWLLLVDGEDYDATYDSAGAFFRNATTSEKWTAALRAVRAPLGSVTTRAVKSTTTAKTLPGAPDGEYVVFQFATAFERKQAATETVTAVKENDGAWRVVGYFIR